MRVNLVVPRGNLLIFSTHYYSMCKFPADMLLNNIIQLYIKSVVTLIRVKDTKR